MVSEVFTNEDGTPTWEYLLYLSIKKKKKKWSLFAHNFVLTLQDLHLVRITPFVFGKVSGVWFPLLE